MVKYSGQVNFALACPSAFAVRLYKYLIVNKDKLSEHAQVKVNKLY